MHLCMQMCVCICVYAIVCTHLYIWSDVALYDLVCELDVYDFMSMKVAL